MPRRREHRHVGTGFAHGAFAVRIRTCGGTANDDPLKRSTRTVGEERDAAHALEERTTRGTRSEAEVAHLHAVNGDERLPLGGSWAPLEVLGEGVHHHGRPVLRAAEIEHDVTGEAQEHDASLGGRVALVLDGGPCRVGVESTVVDLSGPTARLLRPGGVPLEALEAALGKIALAMSSNEARHQIGRAHV